MTMQNVIEARIKAKANERERIGMFGPAALIVGAPIMAILMFGGGLILMAIPLIMLISGIIWGNARKNRQEQIDDEIEVLMAELEDVEWLDSSAQSATR